MNILDKDYVATKIQNKVKKINNGFIFVSTNFNIWLRD